jgi:protein TonB
MISGRARRSAFTTAMALLLTAAFFLVLPIIQAITADKDTDTLLRSVDTVALPPPPPPPPEVEEEKPPEPPEKPQEIEPEAQPLDLSQLELALNPGMGGGFGAADFAIKIDQGSGGGDSGGGLFSVADLDQQPRVIYPHNPQMTPAIRRKAPGTVYVVFIVDENGRVQSPAVQQSPDPVFDKAAIEAIKKWKFEPGKRSGKPVRFRMRQPITFPDK